MWLFVEYVFYKFVEYTCRICPIKLEIYVFIYNVHNSFQLTVFESAE